MQLLVSVANADEAAAALAGGADIIDAKDPCAGALGAVPARVLRDIRNVVGHARPVTAALGDASDARAIECAAREYSGAGAVFVKIGFAGIDTASRIEALVAAAVSGARSGDAQAGVVAVVYADADPASSVAFDGILSAAAHSGAEGILVDTADKDGPGLRQLVTAATLARWVGDARAAGLFMAVAGRLTTDDLVFVRDSGADIAGVRGAACDGGRTGRVSAEKVRLLTATRR